MCTNEHWTHRDVSDCSIIHVTSPKMETYGIAVEPSINLQFSPFKLGCDTSINTTDAMYPIIIPNAVHICHIITNAPRMFVGEHSAPYLLAVSVRTITT